MYFVLASADKDVVGEDGRGCLFSQHVEDDDEDINNLTEEMWGIKLESEVDEGEEDTESLLSDSEDDYNPLDVLDDAQSKWT